MSFICVDVAKKKDIPPKNVGKGKKVFKVTNKGKA